MYRHRKEIISKFDAFRESILDATSSENADTLECLEEVMRDLSCWTTDVIHQARKVRRSNLDK